MTTSLETTYRRLLWLYPADFRRTRGAEMLDTLLEMAEDGGGRRHAPREMLALTITALRMRAARMPGTPPRESWLTAIRTGALMLIVFGLAEPSIYYLSALVHGFPAVPALIHGLPAVPPLVLGLSGLLGLALALRRRHLAAAIVLLPAGFLGFWHFLAAAALLATLTRRRPRPATGLLAYAPLAPLLVAILTAAGGQFLPEVAGIIRFGLLMALPLGGLLWLAVDERVAMALGLLYLSTLLISLGQLLIGDVYSWTMVAVDLAITALPPALLLGLATDTARRQARL
ncbi:hypothetical protein BJY16_001648 [Actinoplanes octamycinicus]|uniref:Uncharacterized protein n=1 Tax=Actinoplanes octamycinicus TaxID=135948 RepID=A0A7W7GTU8_9ACTN|nr:hypothetical protein [Actinoplanes octamycinicus]MBB4738189.1 hypothetical protein [Actinoplanes octamycinicus]GIE59253.1 hypothetical protein Aoc01nite_46550 [Actinoplanes octamycinicus]